MDDLKNGNDSIYKLGINDPNINIPSTYINSNAAKNINIVKSIPEYEDPKIDIKNSEINYNKPKFKFKGDTFISGIIPGTKSDKIKIKGQKININGNPNSKVNIRKSNIKRKGSSCCCYSLNKHSQKGYIAKRNYDFSLSGIIPGNRYNKALNIDLSSGKMNIKGLKINTNINGIVSDIDKFKGDKINIPDINLRKWVLNKNIEDNICNKNDIIDSNNLETEEKKIGGDINLSKNKLEPNNDYKNKYEFNMSIDREIKCNDNDIKINCLKNSSESDTKSKNKNNSIKSKTINIIIGYNLSQNLSNKNIFSSKIRGEKSEDILPKEVINFINPEMPPNLPNIKINGPKKDLNNYIYFEEAHNLTNINNNHLGRESLNKE